MQRTTSPTVSGTGCPVFLQNSRILVGISPAGVNSGAVVKQVAKIMGGGGGGRPDMAQAGGKDADKMEEAMEKAWSIVESLIK